MESPLRKVRKSKGMTLQKMRSALLDVNQDKTIGYLSLLERGYLWPSREVVDAITRIFDGEVSEIEILYPHRFNNKDVINEQLA